MASMFPRVSACMCVCVCVLCVVEDMDCGLFSSASLQLLSQTSNNSLLHERTSTRTILALQKVRCRALVRLLRAGLGPMFHVSPSSRVPAPYGPHLQPRLCSFGQHSLASFGLFCVVHFLWHGPVLGLKLQARSLLSFWNLPSKLRGNVPTPRRSQMRFWSEHTYVAAMAQVAAGCVSSASLLFAIPHYLSQRTLCFISNCSATVTTRRQYPHHHRPQHQQPGPSNTLA
ncbi:hypothetical protein BD289DRAFT_440794 [Coniella lustricola]|uniref:C2H2-type domain-containing protein n=1 Tax=Coniella lustricola TaxID=2025994 RepID=A0A2T3A048_9PEZI|nr:hypothetical protein BD289DRAFT_440794 [Coniella lustricola]